MQLTKSAAVTDVDGDGKTDRGDTITWSFLLANAGTTTLSGAAVNDPTGRRDHLSHNDLGPG